MLRLTQNQTMSIGGTVRLEYQEQWQAYELLDYWAHAQKLIATFVIDGKEEKVEYVFAPPDFLNSFIPGEIFGFYIGDLLFINSDLLAKRPNWVKYVLVKLFLEKLVDTGLDQTGNVKHWVSLYQTIRWAGTEGELPEHELHELLTLAAQREGTAYYRLDEQVRKFIENGGGDPGDPLEARRKYLDNHHRNRWVRNGRHIERLPSHIKERMRGYRNHAEAVVQALMREGMPELYKAAMFIHELAQIKVGTHIEISREFASVAWALTLEGNGITDLVRFVPNLDNPHANVIVRVQKRNKTWVALRKRLSFVFHRADRQLQEMIQEKRPQLDGLVVRARLKIHEANTALVPINQGAALKDFDEAARILAGLAGFQNEIAGIGSLVKEVALLMKDAENASALLRKAI